MSIRQAIIDANTRFQRALEKDPDLYYHERVVTKEAIDKYSVLLEKHFGDIVADRPCYIVQNEIQFHKYRSLGDGRHACDYIEIWTDSVDNPEDHDVIWVSPDCGGVVESETFDARTEEGWIAARKHWNRCHGVG